MNIIDNDPLKISEQLNWFKIHFKTFEKESLDLVNTIIKRLIFLKVGTNNSERFMNSIIYDALSCLCEVHNSKERYFYFSYRSLIENLVRSSLNKSNDDETRITPLFKEFQSSISNQTLYTQDIYSDLMKEYSFACGYIHNNQSSGLNIMLGYQQMVSTKTLEKNKIKNMLECLLATLENGIRVLSLTRREDILKNFGRNFYFISKLLPKTLANPFI